MEDADRTHCLDPTCNEQPRPGEEWCETHQLEQLAAEQKALQRVNGIAERYRLNTLGQDPLVNAVDPKDCYNCGGLQNTAPILCARCATMYFFLNGQMQAFKDHPEMRKFADLLEPAEAAAPPPPDVLPWLDQAVLDWKAETFRPSSHYIMLFEGAAAEIRRLRDLQAAEQTLLQLIKQECQYISSNDGWGQRHATRLATTILRAITGARNGE
jgi:hypothetical protein